MATYTGPKIPTGFVACVDTSVVKGYSGATLYNIANNNLTWAGDASFVSSTSLNAGATWTSQVTNILDTDTHSIFFRIKFNSSGTYPDGWTGSWNKIFEYTGSSGDRSPGVWRYPSERRIHWRYNPNNTGIDFGNNATFALNTWYFIGVTKNGADATAYINGVQNSTATVSNPKQAGSSAVKLLPGYPTSLGEMNNLYIFNRVLSSTEVKELYDALKLHMGF